MLLAASQALLCPIPYTVVYSWYSALILSVLRGVVQFTFYRRATNQALLVCNQPSLTGTVLAASRALLCPIPYNLWSTYDTSSSSILGSDYLTSYATVVRYHYSFATRSSVIRTRLKETASQTRQSMMARVSTSS